MCLFGKAGPAPWIPEVGLFMESQSPHFSQKTREMGHPASPLLHGYVRCGGVHRGARGVGRGDSCRAGGYSGDGYGISAADDRSDRGIGCRPSRGGGDVHFAAGSLRLGNGGGCIVGSRDCVGGWIKSETCNVAENDSRCCSTGDGARGCGDGRCALSDAGDHPAGSDGGDRCIRTRPTNRVSAAACAARQRRCAAVLVSPSCRHLLGCTLADARGWGINRDGGESWVLEKPFAAYGQGKSDERSESTGNAELMFRRCHDLSETPWTRLHFCSNSQPRNLR